MIYYFFKIIFRSVYVFEPHGVRFTLRAYVSLEFTEGVIDILDICKTFIQVV